MNAMRPGQVGLLLAAMLMGCAMHPPRPPTDPVFARCLDLYGSLDAAVAEHGSSPSSPSRIDGFPYLRVNRFLANRGGQMLTPAETTVWLTRLSKLDLQTRQIEWTSLPIKTRIELNRRYAPVSDVPAVLATCADTLRTADQVDPARLALIRERAWVPDDYRTANQVLGLYPLTRWPVHYGVSRYHEETRALFSKPLTELRVQGELRRYGPSAAPPPPADFSMIPRDALRIPEPTPTQLETLFATHAPVWEIDVATDADQPGSPYWEAEGTPSVDSSDPTIYRYISYAQWRGKPLLQLNYLIWFTARPKTGAFDLLGGPLDGVLWRVTLGSKGQPVLYDSIHACGCYHQLFPSAMLRLRPDTLQWAEPPLAPQAAPVIGNNERMVLRLSSSTHYLQRVYADQPGTVIKLDGRDYAALYAVPMASGHRRSLFGPEGLVMGSERAERWLLWPTGVPSPGAMRERGRHAIAFVGRRHFDDADLLDRLFEPAREKP